MTKKKLADYTEQEFLHFIDKIKKVDFPTESEHDEAVYAFSQLTEHPDGWDLIYHPEPGADNSAAGVTKTVKEWRAANGKPGFKVG
ncbi:bacteriocin immunity protein [Kluyvera ascorbata]|uniref:bacteriocin immunity protein n=1 Tax=Kluyvera ascorbata TaxID=51288 RepID=UPI00055C4EDB|nr:bacteriocin immunity protein [Kluyvera ascorbata]EJG2386655.1 bacteriocin immunity protein [Kluyvera ascorbata]MDU1195682.1 bacteriocin immunity protein [Kluyvera ascorbata]BCA39963.1 pyocin-S2 immunity protein [Kluyvera ascorbata]HBL0732957.1 bacteriocin immunity protein [Kluyvera ascorbata]HDG1681322.1 bacteriocin immunity protein [Kluyvera ascorbata]